MADFYGPWGNPYNTYRTWMSVGYSQNIAGNYTGVSVSAYFQDRYGYGLWGNLRNIVYIGGALVRDSSHSIAGGANASTYIAGSYRDVGHNADGTIGGIGVSSQMIDINYYNGTASGTIYPPTIPRATTPNWSGNFVTGTAKTINLPRASTSFTHTVQYSFGSTGFVNIATGAGDSTSWNPEATLASQIPNATSGTGTIRVITYSGSTNIGTKDVSFTLDLDSSIVPTVSEVTWSDTNSTVATNIGAFVQGLSQVKGVVTSAGVHGSTISSEHVIIGGTQANENVGVLLTGSGTVSAVAYATDSRGRIGSRTQNITSLAYSPPSIISSSVRRALSNGTVNDQGTYLRIDLNASVSSLIVSSVQKNAMKISVRTQQTGGSWVSRNVIDTGLTHNTYFLVSGGGIFSVANSYDVEIAITDNTSVSASIVSTKIPTATVTLDLDGTNVGVGKYHENGVLDVAGDVYTSGGIYSTGNLTVGGSALLTSASGAVVPSRGGFPTGGTTGQVLLKRSATDRDVIWSEIEPHNYVINGGFDIWQRATSSTAGGYGSADRWYSAQGGTVTKSQQTTGVPVGSRYCMRVAYGAASSYANQLTGFEDSNVAMLKGKKVTVSALLRRNSTFAANLILVLDKGNTANVVSTGTWTEIASVSVPNASLPTGTGSSNWYKATLTTTIPNDSTVAGLRVRIAESVAGPSGAYWEVAQVQLEEGEVATNFRRAGLTIQGELAECQRYFQYGRMVGRDYGVVQTIDSGAQSNYSYQVQLRVAPTLTNVSLSLAGGGYDYFYEMNDVRGTGFVYRKGGGSGNGNNYFDLTFSASAELP